LKKGESADFKVIEFNKEFKELLSHTAIFREEEKKCGKQLLKPTSSSASETNASSTLGDSV
jgi:small subunit ribosomal protein S1